MATESVDALAAAASGNAAAGGAGPPSFLAAAAAIDRSRWGTDVDAEAQLLAQEEPLGVARVDARVAAAAAPRSDPSADAVDEARAKEKPPPGTEPAWQVRKLGVGVCS
jgi:hypothetical protein